MFAVLNTTSKIISIQSLAAPGWSYGVTEECFSYELMSPELEDEVLRSFFVGLFS
jgi:hypothetical protein